MLVTEVCECNIKQVKLCVPGLYMYVCNLAAHKYLLLT